MDNLYEKAMQVEGEIDARSIYLQLLNKEMKILPLKLEADRIVRKNLGYFAAFYDQSTRERVEKLFRCVHPFLGSCEKHWEPAEILEIGMRVNDKDYREYPQPGGPPYSISYYEEP